MPQGPKSIKPVDLRRPNIPKAAPLPNIPGPRGGPAYRPHPNDLPKDGNPRNRRGYGMAEAVDLIPVHPIMPFTLAWGFAVGCAQVLGLI